MNVDWIVPRTAASFTFSIKSFSVSSARAITSVRLQNWYGRRIISEHGLVPKSWSGSRLPFFLQTFLDASREKIPRSPDLDSYNDNHSCINWWTSGFSVYTAELFESARWTFCSHQAPDLAFLIRSSDRFESEIIAERRTPPTTTTSPILHIISWHSIDVSFRPFAPLNTFTTKWNNSSSGAGPEERPPNVFRTVPAGRSFDRSHFGNSPE